MKQKYYTLGILEKVTKKSRFRWRFVLTSSILLYLIALVSGYFITSESTFKGKTEIASVVLIVNKDKAGTGFIVAENLILTAAHVVEGIGNVVNFYNESGLSGSGKVVVSGYNDWKKFLTPDGMVKEGATKYDWSLIEMDTPVEDIEPMYLGSSQDAIQGDRVYLIGYPGGQELVTSQGIVSRNDPEEISTDGNIDPGFSGGPMILVRDDEKIEDGSVIGIIVSVPVGYTTIKKAVPIDIVISECSKAKYLF